MKKYIFTRDYAAFMVSPLCEVDHHSAVSSLDRRRPRISLEPGRHVRAIQLSRAAVTSRCFYADFWRRATAAATRWAGRRVMALAC